MRGVSLNHLVGAGEQRRRDDEAERSRGFEIHGQLKFGGLHYRQVRSVLALENPASIRRRLAIGVRQVGAVTHEAAGENIFAPSVQPATPCRVASATILSRWLSKNGSAATISTSTPCFTEVNDKSSSVSELALMTLSSIPNARAVESPAVGSILNLGWDGLSR